MKTGVGAIATAVGVVWVGRKQALFTERLFLSLVLVIIALIYVVFGVHDGDEKHLREELMGLALYGSIAAIGHTRSIWWLVFGMAGHAVWDWAHQPQLLEGYTPAWYRNYCILVDLLLAGYIAIEQPE